MPNGKPWTRTLPLWFAAGWAMGLTSLGLFVVPMLFANLPTPSMAGTMAAKLFAVQTGISLVCALLLLLTLKSKNRWVGPAVAEGAIRYVLVGALMALLVEFGVSPRIIARENLALWHGIGSGMYLIQWMCALVVFGKLAGEISKPE
jgi:hypothetical protein